jgi:hypothetical protein
MLYELISNMDYYLNIENMTFDNIIKLGKNYHNQLFASHMNERSYIHNKNKLHQIL